MTQEIRHLTPASNLYVGLTPAEIVSNSSLVTSVGFSDRNSRRAVDREPGFSNMFQYLFCGIGPVAPWRSVLTAEAPEHGHVDIMF